MPHPSNQRATPLPFVAYHSKLFWWSVAQESKYTTPGGYLRTLAINERTSGEPSGFMTKPETSGSIGLLDETSTSARATDKCVRG